MHKLNVFNNPKLPLRYPKNWLRMTRTFFRSFKWAYQRITRGIANCDCWDWNSTILAYLNEGLDWFINHTISYPGDDEFPTYESWINYLKEIKQLLYRADETNEYYPTPCGDLWWTTVQRGEENADLVKAMGEEAKSNDRLREQDFNKAWEMLGHVFWNLWD